MADSSYLAPCISGARGASRKRRGGCDTPGNGVRDHAACTTIEVAPEAVFVLLADPSAHAGIDGTGWVRGSLQSDRITAGGQVFRMAVYHPEHPDKDYVIANLVEVFEAPRAIGWKPGGPGAQLRWLDMALRP